MTNDALSTVTDHAQQAGLDYKNQVDEAAVKQDGQNYISAVVAGDAQGANVWRAMMQNRRTENLGFNGTPLLQADGTPNPIASLSFLNDSSQVHAQVISNLLGLGTADGVNRANAYFQANQGEMDAATRGSVGSVVNERYGAQGAANAAQAEAGAPGATVSHDAALNSALGADTASGPSAPVPIGAAAARSLVVQAGATPAEADDLARVAMLESSGGKNLRNLRPGSTSAGWWGFTNDTWKALGGTDANRNDPAVQAQMALKLYRQDRASLASNLGRQPSTMELYLAHQQGVGKAEALLKANQTAPSTLAADVLTPLYNGNRARAVGAIANNGGTPTSTVGQFLSTWAGQVNGGSAAIASATAPPSTPMTIQPPIEDKATFIANVVRRAPPGASQQVVAQYQAAAENLYNQQHAAIEDRSNDAWSAIQPLLRDDTITSYDQLLSRIPGPVIANLKQTQLTELYNSYKNAGGPYAKVSDPSVKTQIWSQFGDADAVSKIDPAPLVSKLTPSDYTELLNQKNAAKNGTGAYDVKNVSRQLVTSAVNGSLHAAGLDPAKSTTDAAAVSQLTARMFDWADQETQANGKPPKPAEVQQRLDWELLNGTDQNGRVIHTFESTGPGFSYVIPKDVQSRLNAAWSAQPGHAGQSMPRDMMVDYWVRGHRHGIFAGYPTQ